VSGALTTKNNEQQIVVNAKLAKNMMSSLDVNQLLLDLLQYRKGKYLPDLSCLCYGVFLRVILLILAY
jgi:hypothetical protein